MTEPYKQYNQWGFTDVAGRSHQFLGNPQNLEHAAQQINSQAPMTHGDATQIIKLLTDILAELREHPRIKVETPDA